MSYPSVINVLSFSHNVLYFSHKVLSFSPDVQLIDDEPKSRSRSSLELDEVEISNPKLEEVLKDEHWVDDAT